MPEAQLVTREWSRDRKAKKREQLLAPILDPRSGAARGGEVQRCRVSINVSEVSAKVRSRVSRFESGAVWVSRT